MPAVQVDDPTTLPRIGPVDQTAIDRPVRDVVTAQKTLEGEGFEVRRAFTGMDLRLADPFLLLDQMGAVEYSPGEAKGAPDHPHRGFETVTYMMDGELEHRDSNGGGGLITDGATQWMTAGAGIVHSEMPTEQILMKGGLFHGVQLWVNLPKAQKWSPSAYQDIDADNVVLLTSDDGGALIRLIAGDLGEHNGPGGTRTRALDQPRHHRDQQLAPLGLGHLRPTLQAAAWRSKTKRSRYSAKPSSLSASRM